MDKAEKVQAIRTDDGGETGVATRLHYLPEERGSADVQRFFQRFPRVYAWVKAVLTPTMTSHSWKTQVPDPARHVVLNLGAGTETLHPQLINLDFVAFRHIDIVADFAKPLPIRPASVDAVLSISVLEHLERAAFVVAEVARILKPGGLFYLATPFQYPYHGAPYDFTRWTLPGLRVLLGDDFEVVASGSRGGPMGVVILALAHAAAQLSCFSLAPLYTGVNFAMLGLLAPLKLLDLLFERLPFHTTLCTGYFVTARRRAELGAEHSAGASAWRATAIGSSPRIRLPN